MDVPSLELASSTIFIILGLIATLTAILLLVQRDRSVGSFILLIGLGSLAGASIVYIGHWLPSLGAVIAIGALVAWMGRDELVRGRRWFVALVLVSIIASFFSFVRASPPLGALFLSMALIAGESLAASYWSALTHYPLDEN